MVRKVWAQIFLLSSVPVGCRHQSALSIFLLTIFSDPVCPIFFFCTCDKLPFEYYPRGGFKYARGLRAFQVALVVKNLPMISVLNTIRDMWVGKIPWKRAWQSTPVFLPGKSIGQRSLTSYRPWGCKESDTTKAT